jgi:protein-arginine deiminase
MRRRTKLGAIIALALAASASSAACGGDDDEATGASTSGPSGTTTGEQPPEPVIDIAVDTNRDGVANAADPADQDGEELWDATHGASFLANLDDDDLNGVRDVDDEVLGGDTDIADLARVMVSAWPEAPDGASGVLTLDDVGAGNVRLWKKGLDGAWTLVAGGLGACNDTTAVCTVVPVVNFSAEEVRAGLELGVEGLRFRMSGADGEWSGQLDVKYSVLDPATGLPITTTAVPDGVDLVKLRVAPWLLWGNLSPFDRVHSSDDSAKFVSGVRAATDDAGIAYDTYGNWGDQWTQDFFQTGYTAIPGPNGTVQGMRIANARPWGRSNSDSQLPIRWLEKNYLDADQGIVEVYKTPHTGDSYDSHGNHDLIPPYTNGDQSFPMAASSSARAC